MNSLTLDQTLDLLHQHTPRGTTTELFLKESASRQWVRTGTSFRTEESRERGGALRTMLAGGRCGMAFASAPRPDGLPGLVTWALELARHTAPDPHLSFPNRPAPVSDPGPDHRLPDPVTVRALLDRLVDRAAGRLPRGIRLLSAWFQQGALATRLCNTAGFTGAYHWARASLGLLLAQESGSTVPLSHRELLGADATTPDEILENAIRRATGLFGPPADAPSGPTTLVLAPEAAAPLLSALGSLFVPPSGPTKGPCLPEPGTMVARSGITLQDHGHHPLGLCSAPFDGEGSPAAATTLVRDGLLETLVHDRRSAALAGTRTTGNAIRDSYRQRPAPGLSTLVLRPSPGIDQENLLSGIGEGFLALDAGRPDPGRLEAGLCSIHLRGRLIRHGRPGPPAVPVQIRLPLDRLLGKLATASGSSKTVCGDGCVETPMVRMEGVRLEAGYP